MYDPHLLSSTEETNLEGRDLLVATDTVCLAATAAREERGSCTRLMGSFVSLADLSFKYISRETVVFNFLPRSHHRSDIVRK